MNNDDCPNGGVCLGDGENKFCKCAKDYCGTGEDVTCLYDGKQSKAVCYCTDNEKKFDKKEKMCNDKCKSDHDCGINGRCQEEICKCLPGYSGKNCGDVSGCTVEFNKICTNAEATCVHDGIAPYAKCKCTDAQKEYDKHAKKCDVAWCLKHPCGPHAKCAFDEGKKTGYCKCEDKSLYYDYQTQSCKEPDKCSLRKDPCGKNYKCQEGNCTCPEDFEEKDGKCTPKCENDGDGCSGGAECTVENGVKRCQCKEGFYFDGSKCSDGKCVLKKECCPEEYKEEGKCENDKGCGKDCGYGVCRIKEDGENKKETCECDTSVAKLDDKKDKCILKQNVCASKKLTSDSSKCECSGKFKQAANKITCEKVTCSDTSAQDDCKTRGATCIDTQDSYDCKCPVGLIMDGANRICRDQCSEDSGLPGGKVCYNGELKSKGQKSEPEWRCPPALQESSDKNCSEVATDAYIIRNIPVLKSRYKLQNGINHVLLNSDLIKSMKATYKEFGHGYLYSYESKGDVLNCSVWIHFQREPGIVEKVKQVLFQTASFNCSGCDPNLTLWPPFVLINKSYWYDVKIDNLTFCSVKETLCGHDSVCNTTINECSCPKGYKPLKFSVKKTKAYKIQRCEDINECQIDAHNCPEKTTTCENTAGDYYCKCKFGYKKKMDPLLERRVKNKEACVELCDPDPCGHGECVLTTDNFDCRCSVGFEGSFCDRSSPSFAAAKKKTAVVGAVLGTLLAITLVAFFLFYWRIKKNSYSEDFEPTPRQNHAAEMMERRPVRGVINQSYE